MKPDGTSCLAWSYLADSSVESMVPNSIRKLAKCAQDKLILIIAGGEIGILGFLRSRSVKTLPQQSYARTVALVYAHSLGLTPR